MRTLVIWYVITIVFLSLLWLCDYMVSRKVDVRSYMCVWRHTAADRTKCNYSEKFVDGGYAGVLEV